MPGLGTIYPAASQCQCGRRQDAPRPSARLQCVLVGGGLFGGIAAGFLGAGLFGLLFGHGLFGGMAGFASILGLLLQVMLVVIVARLIFAWWQRRSCQRLRMRQRSRRLDTALAVSVQFWPAPMHHRPANLLPSPSRTMTRLNDCSATSKQLIRRKTFRPCARRSRPRDAVLFLRAVGGRRKSRPNQCRH